MTFEDYKNFVGDSNQIGESLGITAGQVRRLAKEGMPYKGGSGVIYDCHQWYSKKAKKTTEFESCKIKKVKSETKKINLEIREMTGELIRFKDAEQMIQKLLARMKNEIFSVGAALSSELSQEESQAMCRKIVEEGNIAAINRTVERFRDEFTKK